MKMFQPKAQVPVSQADVDKLRVALDLERKIADTVPAIADSPIDTQLVTEFRRNLRQTECHIERLEDLLRHYAAA
jgi:ferritin-like metal-binding protein YciE